MFVNQSGCEVDESGFWLGWVRIKACTHLIASTHGTKTQKLKNKSEEE